MDKVLQRVGRFLGEKFALIDRVYLKKGELPKQTGRNSGVVDGYVDMLPPRPVKGDRYVIRPDSPMLFKGIYYLNFGRNREDRVFKIIGDSEAKAVGTNREASVSGAGVETGKIAVSAGGTLRVMVAAATDRRKMNGVVDEYNGAGILVKTGVLGDNGYFHAEYRVSAETQRVVLRVTGTGSISNIKVWEACGLANHGCVYCWDGLAWREERVMQGVLLGVKGKGYGLVPEEKQFREVCMVSVPKLEIASGVFSGIKKINLRQEVNGEYEVRLFVKRRRLCKAKKEAKALAKNKYWECLEKRKHHVRYTVQWYQPLNVPLSRRFRTTTGCVSLDYSWGDLVRLVFTKAGQISGKTNVVADKYYPSTGLYCRSKHKNRKESDYADYALCLAKKVGGKWIEGEKSYFRIRQFKKVSMEETVCVRVLN